MAIDGICGLVEAGIDVDHPAGTRRVADAGVGIDLIYLAAGERVVLGVDDLELALAALQ